MTIKNIKRFLSFALALVLVLTCIPATVLDERNVIVDDNTVITNGQWPTEAQAIINSAGVSAAYKGLLNGVELPSWHTDFGKNVPENYEF